MIWGDLGYNIIIAYIAKLIVLQIYIFGLRRKQIVIQKSTQFSH